MTYRYKVEYQDASTDKTVTLGYYLNKQTAMAAARMKSYHENIQLAYAVAVLDGRSVGHRSYARGLMDETVGEGFASRVPAKPAKRGAHT